MLLDHNDRPSLRLETRVQFPGTAIWAERKYQWEEFRERGGGTSSRGDGIWKPLCLTAASTFGGTENLEAEGPEV